MGKEKLNDLTKALMNERFGHDTLLSVATVNSFDGTPRVRIVNAYYEDGAFYVITHSLSNKMYEIGRNNKVAVCGEWFKAIGIGENIGHPRDEKNAAVMERIREAFKAWYSNGHTNEDDRGTCILKIALTDAELWHHGTCYEIYF